MGNVAALFNLALGIDRGDAAGQPGTPNPVGSKQRCEHISGRETVPFPRPFFVKLHLAHRLPDDYTVDIRQAFFRQ